MRLFNNSGTHIVLSTKYLRVCLFRLWPPELRVVGRRNLPRRRVPTMCMTCAGFYVYRGRLYENNDILPKNVRRQARTFAVATSAVRPQAVGLYPPAGWLAAAAQWLAIVTQQACHNLIGPSVFTNVGR